jgi:chorismate lyase/3-hydroxybenzoate synthase
MRRNVVEYALPETARLDASALGAVAFGDAAAADDPRVLQVRLATPDQRGVVELWRGAGPVERGVSGPIRYAHDGDLLFGILEMDELKHGGILGAAQAAYEAIAGFHRDREQKHVLRIWNYIDAINRGSGDQERYKQFCLGRARGFGNVPDSAFPAATAVGRRDGLPVLQLCWLAGREAGTPLENPRQLQAYRYPRQYGPAAPSFSRAVRVPRGQLMISGTASIVGSESVHAGDLSGQLDETARNLRSVLAAAAAGGSAATALPMPGTVVKTYLRDAARAPVAADQLRRALGGEVEVLVLVADICRSELLVEIECLCD